MSEYEAVIGLEVHVQLKTESKIFCGCPVTFGAPPNSSVCPVCLGLPGALPVLNEKAVRYAALAGMMLGGRVARFSKFDRKNYFYPDLPKNFQISQYDLPFCVGGGLEIELDGGGRKRIGINRVHLEEDAGKLVHGDVAGGDSGVDYNRSGVPLIEIVSEPEISSPDEAHSYLKALKLALQYLGVSDCDMEKGSLRCDANVSVRPRGARGLGVKAEVKNMNSFRAVQRALAYEIDRQTSALRAGGRVISETRLWEAEEGVTRPMRSKEEAHDYRYFPEPDLVPVAPDDSWIERLRRSLPEAPIARRDRFVSAYGLAPYDADVLTADREIADYFEAVVAAGAGAKAAGHFIMGEMLRTLKDAGAGIAACRARPEAVAGLLGLVAAGTISAATAKGVFAEMFKTGAAPGEIVRAKALGQISDAGELAGVVDGVIAANPKSVGDYRAGKTKALGFLVGQIMKATGGKGNPQVVNALLRERLGG
jgi:aspartyl-tRNA(Asn)/glutamyl-tRNA(Gln) amidotransferase subunit B